MESFQVFVFMASLLFSSNSVTAIFSRTPSKVVVATPNEDDGKLSTYIIHVLPPAMVASSSDDLERYYKSFLPEIFAVSGETRMVFTYSEVFSGFAARLTEAEVEAMKRKPGFVRAIPDRSLSLLTTHTPEFLGLQQGSLVWNASALGSGVIIGMIDSGVDHAHPSFAGDGVPPPPAKWKGSCRSVGYNNKLIGIQSYSNESGVDRVGHGTHTASTAAGNFVKDVSFLGQANGTASGMAPHAHLAIYQVCAGSECFHSSILAGLDAAVKDGVDVISVSLGISVEPRDPPIHFNDDALAVGALGATEKGVMVVCAGGNNGPEAGTVSNSSPWILTVAASTMDRSLRSVVTLGDGKEIEGESPYQPGNFSSSSMFPLYFPEDCSGLSPEVKGKLVVCSVASLPDGGLDSILRDAGAVGLILIMPQQCGFDLYDDELPSFPTSEVTFDDGWKIISYVNSTENPIASITFKGTLLGVSPAPVVAHFSSRGPNRPSPGILKPDITGPGVNVLAAWPFASGGVEAGGKTFDIQSGTSMSTPHLSGIAALLRSMHRDWSPAAIKSAIMTTSDEFRMDGGRILDERHHNANFFSMGAGHVNLSKALDPGLVYDLDVDDYARYLCGLGLGDLNVSAILRRNNFSCSDVGNITQVDLNYPSIVVNPRLGLEVVAFNRTVTNVGPATSTYAVKVDVPSGIEVKVEPEKLRFSEVGQKMSFKVRVRAGDMKQGVVEGNLRWVSADHIVRSPIVIAFGHL